MPGKPVQRETPSTGDASYEVTASGVVIPLRGYSDAPRVVSGEHGAPVTSMFADDGARVGDRPRGPVCKVGRVTADTSMFAEPEFDETDLLMGTAQGATGWAGAETVGGYDPVHVLQDEVSALIRARYAPVITDVDTPNLGLATKTALAEAADPDDVQILSAEQMLKMNDEELHEIYCAPYFCGMNDADNCPVIAAALYMRDDDPDDTDLDPWDEPMSSYIDGWGERDLALAANAAIVAGRA